jgi:hypothetical protein
MHPPLGSVTGGLTPLIPGPLYIADCQNALVSTVLKGVIKTRVHRITTCTKSLEFLFCLNELVGHGGRIALAQGIVDDLDYLVGNNGQLALLGA